MTVLIFSIPAVQTFFGSYATNQLNTKFGTNINVQKVGLQFNGDIELKNILIKDHHNDTLIAIEELNSSIISFANIQNNKLIFRDIDLYGLFFHIKTYESELESNLDVFVNSFEQNQQPSETPFKLSSKDLRVYGSIFKLTDQNKINSQILDFHDLHIKASNFWINGPDVHASIGALKFKDPRGVEVKNFQTDFNYTLNAMNFDGLHLETNRSNLEGEMKFLYDREDLKSFADKVNIQATFSSSTINLGELNVFYPEFGHSTTVHFQTILEGTINDLKLNDLDLYSDGQTRIQGDLAFKNLVNKSSGSFEMDGDFESLNSNHAELKAILPRLLGKNLPTNLVPLGTFSARGNLKISDNNIDAKFNISTAIGDVFTDLKLFDFEVVDNARYRGQINLKAFDLGQLINDSNFGMVTSNLQLQGQGFTIDNIKSNIVGGFENFEYNKYHYKDVAVEGYVQDRVFKGALQTNDKNLQLAFEGLVDFSGKENIYDFVADIKHADLNALNFVSRDEISILKGRLEMDMRGTTLDDMYGVLQFKNTLYTNQNNPYYFEDFQIISSFDSDQNHSIAINSPEIIRGSLSGKFMINEVPSMLKNALANLYSNRSTYKVAAGQSLNFNFKIHNKIMEVFFPKLSVGTNTFVKGYLESNPKQFVLTFKSPNIELDQYLADNIEIQLSNDNPIFNTYIEIDRLKTPFYEAQDFDLINITLNDTLYIKSQFKGGKEFKDDFDLNFYYTISEENSIFGMKSSKAFFKNTPWVINKNSNDKNQLIFNPITKAYTLKDLDLSFQNEAILLRGNASDSTTGNLELQFKTVDLAKITPEIDNLSLGGIVDGNLILSKFNNTYLPKSMLEINKFTVNDFLLGSFVADIKGNASLTNYDLNVTLKDDVKESFSAKGQLDVSKENSDLNLNLKFKDFILAPLTPLAGGVITEIEGEVSGAASVTGRLENPQINGSLILNKGHLAVPYLNVNYAFNDQTKVDLKDQSFVFKSAGFKDTQFYSEAVLDGKLSHHNFTNWSLDTTILSDRLLVLNTAETNESLYYGTSFVQGDIHINGLMKQLFIEANVTTSEGTIFKIPLNDSEMISENSYIKFLSPQEKQSKSMGRSIKLDAVEGVEMEFNMDITDDAEIEIVIDKETGSSILGRGNGSILAQINTNDKFQMFGDFLVLSGVYNYSFGKLIQKKFKLVKDGSLVWEGNPLQAEINIEALYDDISVNPSTLLDNPINQSIPAEVKVHLTGALEQPDLDFDIRFPNVNSALNNELRDRLRDRDKRNFQALSLLATGSFRSKIALDSQDAFELVSDGVTNVLNSVFSDDENKVKLGLNLDIGKNTPEFETDSRVGVTVSTKISDNVLVNGKVGVPVGGVSQTTIAGDFEVEVLLNEDRTLSLKFFNRENSIQNFGDQIGYTQGVGLSYNIEFDNLKELLVKLFSEKPSSSPANTNSTLPQSDTPQYIDFKKSSEN